MYANSGYATNSYATRRLFGSGIAAPIVKIAMRILKSGYGIVNVLLLRFNNTTLEL
jgi:hypothetical protein